METATIGTRHVELSAKVFPSCKHCAEPMAHHTEPGKTTCDHYKPDGPVRDLGVIAEGDV